MLLIRQKTLDQKIAQAIADAIAQLPVPVMPPDLSDEVTRLTIEIEALRKVQSLQPAQLVEHVAHVVEAEKRERMSDIANLEGAVAAIPQPTEAPTVDLVPLYQKTADALQQAREADDLATYLLDSPRETTVVRDQVVGVQSAYNGGWMRPMGSR